MTDFPKEILDAAKMAELLRVASTAEAKGFVEELTSNTLAHEAEVRPRKRKRRPQDAKTFAGAIGAFAADLILHSGNAEAEGFCYRSSDKDGLADTLCSSRSFEHLIDFWPAMGLLETTSSIHVKSEWEGEVIGTHFSRARRMRPTADLLALAQRHGITSENLKDHFHREVGRIKPLTVRDERHSASGKRLPSKNIKVSGPRFEEEVARVREMNTILEEGGFDLEDTPRVYRLFNRGNSHDFDFNLGGRLYAASEDDWQRKSSEERSKITWKGEETVELDVKASHLFILYALKGQRLEEDGDPYYLPGVERDVVKGLFVAATGKGTMPKRWPVKLAENYEAKTGIKLSKAYKLGSVREALLKKHPVLGSMKPKRLDWAHLQYEESECFVSAILHLGRYFERAVLPVHDSIIVPRRDMELALDMLGGAYEERFGSRPVIRAKD